MGQSEKNSRYETSLLVFLSISFACFVGFIVYAILTQETDPVPKIEIASMDFTVRNITQTHISANWDLLVRVPRDLPNDYICLQGDIRASLFYKNTLVTSSGRRYNNLKPHSPQQLKVSAAISEEDIGGLIGKYIIKDIKDKREVKFGSQLFLTDCRKGTTGVLSYMCDETKLRFDPGSETKATKFGNNPTCTNF